MADIDTIELTDEQRAVVNHGRGPLLVNGGPGSGKTRVIVERVARLIESGAASVEQIFCMTFTKKATGEMAQRLKTIRDGRRHRNGGDNALKDITKVQVGTIHSLGMDILKENSHITGITDDTDIFDSLSKMAWCFRNADKMGIDQNILKMNPDGCAKALKGIQQAKAKMWSVADFGEKIDEFSKKGAGSGKAKTGEVVAKMRELAKVYEAYEKHMEDRNMIDYEDMVGKAVKLLSSHESIRQKYADSYVIVDEFQDNNIAQFHLAKLLAGSGNLMAVGDRNQSIMDFQGAYAGIFDEFKDAYPDMVEMDLEKNHRCSQNIQEAACILKSGDYNVNSQAERDPAVTIKPDDIRPELLGLHGAGEPGGEHDDNPPVLAAVAADEETERQFVAAATGLLVRNGVAEQDVAVLCRTNAMCRRFAATLRARGIKVAPENVGIPMSNPIVAEIMALLRIAASPETSGTEIALILERRGISTSNTRTINCTAKSMHRTRQNDRVFETLQRYEKHDQCTEIREISDMILKLHANAAKGGLRATLHDIMFKHTDAYRRYANGHTGESATNRAILRSIYRMADRYNRQHPYDTFSGFVEYVEFASDAIAKDPGLLDSPDDSELYRGVSVLTIHKSKGKEFGRVFVTGLNAPSKRRSADIIPAEMLQDRDGQSERNLLYVATTRAQTGLYLSRPDTVNGKAVDPADFLSHMCGRQDTRRITIPATAADISAPADPLAASIRDIRQDVCDAVLESRLMTAAGRLVELALVLHRQNGNTAKFDPSQTFGTNADADRLLAALNVDAGRADRLQGQNVPLVDRDRLSLSFSAVKNYQECPQKFKYDKILGVPQRPSIYMDKGSIVHRALEMLATGAVDSDGASRYARDEMGKIRCLHQDLEYRAAESSLEDAIRNYAIWEEKSPKPKDTKVEVDFETTIDGVRYTGRIDRIDWYGDGTYRIIDYKTGSSSITKKSIVQDGEDKTIRQPQVVIYAHAAGEMYGSPPATFAFVYVDQGTKRDGCTLREYAIDGESLENGMGIVEECTRDILAEKFDATPDKNICGRCPYKTICPDAIF